MSKTVRLRLPGAPASRVPIVVGSGLARAIAADISRRGAGCRVVFIADERARPHLRPVLAALRVPPGRGARPGREGGRGAATVLLVRSPERAKTREGKAALEDRLLASGAGRDTLIVACGGGALLDLAGFTAATFLRGVPWMALPTTLLAMVDASVGGKVAVNHPSGKNLLGAFHHPVAVYADVGWLRTLPDRAFRAGLAEVVKMAAGLSAPLFRRLETSAAPLCARRPALLGEIVARAVRLKARTVRGDEREAGPRQVLNFGHTIAHALEAAEPGRWLHGEAVSIGLAVESALAVRVSAFPAADRLRLVRLLAGLGLPVRPPSQVSTRRILRLARFDKKTRRGALRYALPARLGRMARTGAGEWTFAVPDAAVRACWDEASRSRPVAGPRPS